ncbi:MAG: DegT/DnrJ/EryC1/StrS family aminotransferase [Spirochaetaceae bacterium]|jgi:dTDP-4-amino-4,6-dideoxygalactose transaminase|nr:DegT/DnrJ/EryC1/StrS family aminotransferase [Spirochaetaceae bacterium]
MKIEVYSPTIRRREMDAVLTALVEDKVGPGEQAKLLIQIAKEQFQYDFCLALRSPAFALYIALRALNMEDGQGVVVSALSPRYYGDVIRELRLKPVYCDVASGTAVMSRETVQAAVGRDGEGPTARCIVVNHTLGYVPDMAAIGEAGLPVIEDCSQSCGTVIGETRAGSFGAVTIVGLEERDMITAGGGALLYAVNRRDAGALRGIKPLSEYGLPDMNAAMAVSQFREASRNMEKRREIAAAYTQAALRTRHSRFIQPGEWDYNNYAFPLILETGMKDVKAYARRMGIVVEDAFGDTLTGSGDVPSGLCPEAYSLSLRTALFPLYPRLGAAEIEKVAKLITTLP